MQIVNYFFAIVFTLEAAIKITGFAGDYFKVRFVRAARRAPTPRPSPRALPRPSNAPTKLFCWGYSSRVRCPRRAADYATPNFFQLASLWGGLHPCHTPDPLSSGAPPAFASSLSRARVHLTACGGCAATRARAESVVWVVWVVWIFVGCR